MKLIGLVATYSPDSIEKVNNHNYFMNGITKHVLSESRYVDVCEFSKMRNLYALADGTKSEGDGRIAAFLSMDIMNNILGSDFQYMYKNYFDSANKVVQSRSFSDNGAKMSVDLAVLYVYRNWAKVYNFGDVSVFHKSDSGIVKVSGEPPKIVSVDEINDADEWLTIKKSRVNNTPHIGHISDEFAVIPHISDKIQLGKKDSIVMVTKSVLSVLDEEDILSILNDITISQEEKPTAIVAKAIDKNPDGNYTVEIVENKVYKLENKIRIGVVAIVLAALLTLIGTFGMPVINSALSGFMDFINTIMYGDEAEKAYVEKWIPIKVEEESEKKTEAQLNDKTAETKVETPPKTTIFKPASPAKVQAPVDTKTDSKPEDAKKNEAVEKTENTNNTNDTNDTNNTSVVNPAVKPAEQDKPTQPKEEEKPPTVPGLEEDIFDIIQSW